MSRAAQFPWLMRSRRASAQRTGNLRAPRMSSAVRIPDTLRQLELSFAGIGPQIFVHEGARQSLERRLQVACGRSVQLAVTDNRRRMITQRYVDDMLRVRVHMMFLDAPERVKEALVRYVVDGDRSASLVLGEYIEGNSFRIRADQPARGPLRSRGRVHDLGVIMAELNERYFDSAPMEIGITWGRRSRPVGRQRGSIKLGSYGNAERLIRIHPVLDAEWVPRYFVAYVVFHEMLHHFVPAVRSGCRTLLHPPEFGRRERVFRQYQRAIAWEAKHMGRLLSAR